MYYNVVHVSCLNLHEEITILLVGIEKSLKLHMDSSDRAQKFDRKSACWLILLQIYNDDGYLENWRIIL